MRGAVEGCWLRAYSRVNDGLKARQRKAGTKSDVATPTRDADDAEAGDGADGGGQRVEESRMSGAEDMQ